MLNEGSPAFMPAMGGSQASIRLIEGGILQGPRGGTTAILFVLWLVLVSWLLFSFPVRGLHTGFILSCQLDQSVSLQCFRLNDRVLNLSVDLKLSITCQTFRRCEADLAKPRECIDSNHSGETRQLVDSHASIAR